MMVDANPILYVYVSVPKDFELKLDGSVTVQWLTCTLLPLPNAVFP